MSDKITAQIVRTPTFCFISDCKKQSGYDYEYHRSRIKDIYFDGKLPVPSFKLNWLRIDKFPTTAQKLVKGQPVNKRYEIKEGEYVSEAFPEMIPYPAPENFCDSDGDFRFESLYNFVYDVSDDHFEDVEIEWETIMDVNDFEEPPEFCFDGTRGQSFRQESYKVTSNAIKHQKLDEMLFPEVLLHNMPCCLSSKAVYDITREYVFNHIDPTVAKITSNYDFCFEVKKLIPKHEPEIVSYYNLFAKTKREREKLRTTVKKYEEYTIFSMTSEQEKYKGYPVIPSFFAKNEYELKDKIENWLNNLMEAINQPVCECPHCNGKGMFVQTKVDTASAGKECAP